MVFKQTLHHPGLITLELGLIPQWMHILGERRRTPRGDTIGGPSSVYRTHDWSHSVACYGTEDTMSKLLVLVGKIEAHSEFIASMADGGVLSASFLTVDFLGDRHSGFSLDVDHLRVLGNSRMEFGAESFPFQNRS